MWKEISIWGLAPEGRPLYSRWRKHRQKGVEANGRVGVLGLGNTSWSVRDMEPSRAFHTLLGCSFVFHILLYDSTSFYRDEDDEARLAEAKAGRGRSSKADERAEKARSLQRCVMQ